ncbi:hypothetical protein ONE63_009429 [Megalurothrips usitatus]|uniref:Lipase n=1 Tax=Megalurothrips usitatus TaxID=439358 RepID=A0AAV7XS36_9NEOP|nr:hypothetical protein ONE63_009429 [Megalurothrips usitatus]
MIQAAGYAAETHEVRTADGYLLTMHRLPNPGRPAVYVQHGLLASSAVWVVLGRAKALAFLLHEAGFDVWLGNFRGNTYSRGHIKYSVRDKEFWSFTWHESGVEDVPAMIDYVLKASGQAKLVYVGHSMGTTAFFVAASTKPEYNDKVLTGSRAAPRAAPARWGPAPARALTASRFVSQFVSSALGIHEFNPSPNLIHYAVTKLCPNISIVQSLCTNPLYLFAGFNEDQVDEEAMDDITKVVPAGTSRQTLHHFAQLYTSGKFRQLDYGFLRNLLFYRRFSPPEYPVFRVTARTHIYWAESDILAAPKDVERTRDALPNVVSFTRVRHDSFNHLDFMFAKDVVDLLYAELVDSIVVSSGT